MNYEKAIKINVDIENLRNLFIFMSLRVNLAFWPTSRWPTLWILKFSPLLPKAVSNFLPITGKKKCLHITATINQSNSFVEGHFKDFKLIFPNSYILLSSCPSLPKTLPGFCYFMKESPNSSFTMAKMDLIFWLKNTFPNPSFRINIQAPFSMD